MDDRELLELAAKAAGLDLQFCEGNGWPAIVDMKGGGEYWNPLTDDGDALRLAVKLCMTLLIGDGGTVSACIDSDSHSIKAVEVILPDMFAATRRAIVKAAAEVGKRPNTELTRAGTASG